MKDRQNDLINDKVYFNAADIVQLKQDIPNKPLMIVVKKETSLFKDDKKNILKGIRCRWFTSDGQLQETIWNTKDLVLIQTNN